MIEYILSSGALDPIDSSARRPVIIAFLIFIGASVLWLFTLATDEDDNPERLYIANRSLSPVFNGFAIAGEQISVVTLLAFCGGIALFGYDGFHLAIDSLVTLGVLMLLAQKIRNSGRYTLGDLFSLRASGASPRIAAVIVTLAVTIPILMIQLRAAGTGTALLIGMSSSSGAQVLCTVLMGCLVACFAAVAGLRGNSFMHVAKVPVTLATLAVATALALRKFDWDPGSLLSAAVEKSTAQSEYLRPGLWPNSAKFGSLNAFGNHITLVLGTAVMPHLILRISASQTGRTARRSMNIAIGLAAPFVMLLIATGFATAAVVGARDMLASGDAGQSAPVLLSAYVLPAGSTAQIALITLMACVVFFAVLTTVTSVTFAAAVSFAHDIFQRGNRGHARTDSAEVLALRVGAIVICGIGLVLAAAMHSFPTEFLGAFSASVAASCIFPVLIYSFFWSGFKRRGLLWAVYGGLFLCVILTVLSPTVSGNSFALWPGESFDWYPFQTPGLVAVPAAFFLGWLGSATSAESSIDEFRNAEYRILTGEDVGSQVSPLYPGRKIM
ncbi:transporter [Streptomyces mirabilis]|uniref:solute symporter family protein n=1 Tax=Streptomyces mirabilis TaxID=68239 RepID=UPI003318E8E5